MIPGLSTRTIALFRLISYMLFVTPGVFPTAVARAPFSELIMLDLPTLGKPTIATVIFFSVFLLYENRIFWSFSAPVTDDVCFEAIASFSVIDFLKMVVEVAIFDELIFSLAVRRMQGNSLVSNFYQARAFAAGTKSVLLMIRSIFLSCLSTLCSSSLLRDPWGSLESSTWTTTSATSITFFNSLI